MLAIDKTSRARLLGGAAAVAALTVVGLGLTASGTLAAETVRQRVETTTGINLADLHVAPPAPPTAPAAPAGTAQAELPEPPAPPADPSAPTPPPAPAPEPTSFEQDDAVQDDAEQNLPLPDPGPRDGHHEQDGETPAE